MNRRGQSGEIQFMSVVLIAAVLAAGYLGYALYPAYSDELDASQAIHGIANDGWRRIGKEELHKRVMEKLARIGSHVETQAGGQPTEVPGLPIGDDDVTVVCTDQDQDCSESTGEVTLSFQYVRHVPLPGLTGKYLTLHFSSNATASLLPVKW